jgi:hypothetical protein
MNPRDCHFNKTHCEYLEPYGAYIYIIYIYIACWNFNLTFLTLNWLLPQITFHWLTVTHYNTWQMLWNHIFTACACYERDSFWRNRLTPQAVLLSRAKFLKESSLLQYWLKSSNPSLQFIAAIFPICYYQFQLLINICNRTEIAIYKWIVFLQSLWVLCHLEI